ncbi:hypothetical protein N9512_02095 [Amylibacter sp.]|nr:hypothetical protein [Amylibacter sp.]
MMRKILHAIKYAVSFPLRVFRVTLRLKPIDSKAPFSGPLSSEGIYGSSISDASARELKKLFLTREKNSSFNVALNENQKSALVEIFDKLEPIVRSYLGKESYLDGINWMATQPNEKSISGNWHTDNVGNRLKCFVCVEGDGQTPTLIIPSKDRNPKLTTVFRNTTIELLRWLGLKSEREIENQFFASHKTGSLFLFDTQLFHRGGYSSGQTERVIFHLEFSDRRKHKLITGPIGTADYNSFCYDKGLSNVKSFANLLDKDRIVEFSEGVFAYQPK